MEAKRSTKRQFSPKKVSALEALKEPNLRLLSDLLSSEAVTDGDIAFDVNKAYAEEKVGLPIVN